MRPPIHAFAIRAPFWKSTRHACRRRQRDLDMEQIIEPLRARHGADADPRRTRLIMRAIPSTACCRSPPAVAPSCGESQKVRGLWLLRRHLGEGRSRLRQAELPDWMTDGRTEVDHNSIDYARFLSASAGRKVHRRPHLRGGAENLFPGRAQPRALCFRPRRQALRPFHGARKGAWRLFHGTRRLGACPWLRRQRASPGKIRRQGSRARERMGQPPLLAACPMPSILAMTDDCGIGPTSRISTWLISRGRITVELLEWLVCCEDRWRRQCRQGHLHALPR